MCGCGVSENCCRNQGGVSVVACGGGVEGLALRCCLGLGLALGLRCCLGLGLALGFGVGDGVASERARVWCTLSSPHPRPDSAPGCESDTGNAHGRAAASSNRVPSGFQPCCFHPTVLADWGGGLQHAMGQGCQRLSKPLCESPAQTGAGLPKSPQTSLQVSSRKSGKQQPSSLGVPVMGCFFLD